MRYYIVPKVTDVGVMGVRSKYIARDELGAGWNVGASQAMDYGLEGVFVLALNLSTGDNTTLAAQADVLAVPTPIDNLVTAGALNTVQTKLEAANIPADWVTTSLTYRQCLARVFRIVIIMQRYRGLFGRLFAAGATLDFRINQIPANARTALTDAAVSFGASTASITGTTLLRQALVIVADQILVGGLAFGGEIF